MRIDVLIAPERLRSGTAATSRAVTGASAPQSLARQRRDTAATWHRDRHDR